MGSYAGKRHKLCKLHTDKVKQINYYVEFKLVKVKVKKLRQRRKIVS